MRRDVGVIAVVTGGEQSGNKGISNAVKREITQGLQEGHGVDKGVADAVADTCAFFDFETCEGIYLYNKSVRCMAC